MNKGINREVIIEILDMLEDLDYFIFSGFAIYLYTKGKREFSDIDILLRYKDLKKLASRLGGKIEKKRIEKGEFITTDYFLEVGFKGQEVEAISIIPENKNQGEVFNKQFLNRKKKNFQGRDVFLTPKEGILVHKAILGREKDIKDLELLKGEIDKKLLKEIAKLRGEYEKVIKRLNKVGYNIS